jgi:DNA repair exonuclease SbcCD ATPase subunit
VTWVLNSIALAGYCGVGGTRREMTLDRPLTVLIGPNGAGKTTFVSAIEWALFGALACVESANALDMARAALRSVYIHDGCESACAELTWRENGQTLTWMRRRTLGKRGAVEDVVEAMRDGVRIDVDPDASARACEKIFGLDDAQYRIAVAPSQRLIQGLVAGEREDERNGAIDALFGIELLRALSEGLSQAKDSVGRQANSILQGLETRRQSLANQVATEFDTRAQRRGEALSAGVPGTSLSFDGARGLASDLAKELRQEVRPAPTEIEALAAWSAELFQLANGAAIDPVPWAARALDRAGSATTDVAAARRSWSDAVGARDRAEQALAELIDAHGSPDEVERSAEEVRKRIEEAEEDIARLDARAAVLVRAKDWCEKIAAPADSSVDCPVCAKPAVMDELARVVDDELARLSAPGGPKAGLAERIGSLKQELNELQRTLGACNGAMQAVKESKEAVLSRFTKLRQAVNGAASRWDGIEPCPNEEPVIREARRLAGAADALNTIMQASGAVAAASAAPDAVKDAERALDRNCLALDREAQAAIENLRKAIEEGGDTAAQLRRRALALQSLVAFLRADASLNALDKTLASGDLAAASRGIDDLARWKQLLDIAARVAGDVAVEAAKESVQAVAPQLNRCFHAVASHFRLKTATIDAQPAPRGHLKNQYLIRADDGGGFKAFAEPRLSAGYQMALAVSALCAVANMDPPGHEMGLLVLDEPTQRLDVAMRRQLALMLAETQPAPRTIICLTDRDEEFAAEIANAAPNYVGVYRFEPFSAAGTRFERVS